MKWTTIILVILFLVATIKGDDSTTVDHFKKMSYQEQSKAFDQASPELKSKLQPILLHSTLLHQFGGEEGLKREKESQRIYARGLGPLDYFYQLQYDLCTDYLYENATVNHQSGMSDAEIMVAYNKLKTQYQDPIAKRLTTIHQLLFNAAPTPEALALAAKARKLNEQIKSSVHYGESGPIQITKKEFDQIYAEGDDLFEQIKRLSSLSAEQIKKEYDAIPDEKVKVDMGAPSL